jgi:hypothetical protein
MLELSLDFLRKLISALGAFRILGKCVPLESSGD